MRKGFAPLWKTKKPGRFEKLIIILSCYHIALSFHTFDLPAGCSAQILITQAALKAARPYCAEPACRSGCMSLLEPTVFERKYRNMEIREETAFNAMRYLFAGTYHDAVTVVSCTYLIEKIVKKCLKAVGWRISEKVKEKKNET